MADPSKVHSLFQEFSFLARYANPDEILEVNVHAFESDDGFLATLWAQPEGNLWDGPDLGIWQRWLYLLDRKGAEVAALATHENVETAMKRIPDAEQVYMVLSIVEHKGCPQPPHPAQSWNGRKITIYRSKKTPLAQVIDDLSQKAAVLISRRMHDRSQIFMRTGSRV